MSENELNNAIYYVVQNQWGYRDDLTKILDNNSKCSLCFFQRLLV